SPMQVLEELLQVAIPKNQLDDHYFLFPVFTWRALEYFGWEYARFIGRAPVRYITRPTDPTSLAEIDRLIDKHGLLERELRANTRRYLLRQPELSVRTKLRALLMWHTGPEVRMAQRMLAPDIQPEPERVAALPFHTQDELLGEIEQLIGRLPVGERLPAANLA